MSKQSGWASRGIRVGSGALALLLAPVAAGFTWRGCNGWELTTSGNAEAIDACTQNQYMDCNPTGWEGILAMGAGLVVVICFLAGTAVGFIGRQARPAST